MLSRLLALLFLVAPIFSVNAQELLHHKLSKEFAPLSKAETLVALKLVENKITNEFSAIVAQNLTPKDPDAGIRELGLF